MHVYVTTLWTLAGPCSILWVVGIKAALCGLHVHDNTQQENVDGERESIYKVTDKRERRKGRDRVKDWRFFVLVLVT